MKIWITIVLSTLTFTALAQEHLEVTTTVQKTGNLRQRRR